MYEFMPCMRAFRSFDQDDGGSLDIEAATIDNENNTNNSDNNICYTYSGVQQVLSKMPLSFLEPRFPVES